MLDSGVRIAAASLPVGVPVLVGLVVAVLRRRALPGVAGPAIVGLLLQLLAVLAATFLVAEASLGLFGLDPTALLTVSSVVGFAVIVLQVLSWTLILVALFRRLPARGDDRTPTGRHALLDDQGDQVIAEEGTTLLPVGAALAGAGAGVGLGAAAAGSVRVDESPVAGEADEPAETETLALGPAQGGPAQGGPAQGGPAHGDADATDRSLEEPPGVAAESLDEVADADDLPAPAAADETADETVERRDRDADGSPAEPTTPVSTLGAPDAVGAPDAEVSADEPPEEPATRAPAASAPGSGLSVDHPDSAETATIVTADGVDAGPVPVGGDTTPGAPSAVPAPTDVAAPTDVPAPTATASTAGTRGAAEGEPGGETGGEAGGEADGAPEVTRTADATDDADTNADTNADTDADGAPASSSTEAETPDAETGTATPQPGTATPQPGTATPRPGTATLGPDAAITAVPATGHPTDDSATDGDVDRATTFPAAGDRDTTSGGGHPWFDPDGEASQGASQEAGASRAGSTESR